MTSPWELVDEMNDDCSRDYGTTGMAAGRLMNRRAFLGRTAMAGVLAASGGALAACGSGAASQKTTTSSSAKARRGGHLSVGMSGGSGADSIDALYSFTYLDSARQQQLYNPLLQMNDAAEIEYQLAESIEPQKGNTEWIIRLRPGVTFHNGKDLGAEDVIYSFRGILNPKSPAPGASSLGPMDAAGLTALDKLTVKVPFTAPFGSFLEQLTYWYYLWIVPVGYDPKKPVGTGPFKYQSFTPGQRSTFVRNENYWKPGLPYLDAVTTIDFADNTALQNALVTGVVDGAGALEGAQIKELAAQTGITTVISPSGQITPFTMRVDRAPYSDVRVRLALRLIVNRPDLIASAFDGYATLAHDVFSPWDPDFDASAFHREQDIPQAKALLKAAGQEHLSLQLVTSAVTIGTVQMATVLAGQAAAAGVTIKLNQVDPTAFFGPNYLQWTFSQDFYNYSPYLAQVAQSFLPHSPYNETHWAKPGPPKIGPHYVSLYNQANATTNLGLRREIEHEMQMIDYTEGGYIIPCFPDGLDAYSSTVHGPAPTKVGQPFSNFDFEHFYLA